MTFYSGKKARLALLGFLARLFGLASDWTRLKMAADAPCGAPTLHDDGRNRASELFDYPTCVIFEDVGLDPICLYAYKGQPSLVFNPSSFIQNTMTSTHDVVDLTAASPPPAVAVAAARRPAMEHHAENLIYLSSSDEEDDWNEGKRRYKSDPNKRATAFATNTNNNPANQHPRKRQRTFETQVSGVEVVQVAAAPKPEYTVLEIFPDADLAFIQKLLLENANNAEIAIAYLVENPSYPKTTKKPPPTSSSLTVEMEGEETKWKYDYMSTESFQPTEMYREQAVAQLLVDFPFIKKHSLKQLLTEAKFHYAVAHDRILRAVKGTEVANAGQELIELQYERLVNAFSLVPLSQQEFQRLNGLLPKCIAKRKKKRDPVFVLCPTLQEEIRYVTDKLKQWKNDAQLHCERKKNKEASQRDGTAVECSCCFDKYPFLDMVSCKDEGHLFCCDCVKSYAENQIFGTGNLGIDTRTKQPAMELKCFHGDGCNSGFMRACLEKALPPKTMQKYDSLQCQISIDSANLGSELVTCPKCGFKAVLPSDSQRVFECPVAGCRFASCRECGEAAHIPLRCNEVEKEKETKGRVTVEEAISAAKIRNCPKCNKAFIKSDGCNKIRCGCGAFICYICREVIRGYDHFCQKPHCDHKRCKKCSLWTNAEQDDARAMREAGVHAAEEVREASRLEKNPNRKDPEDVRIDVDSILKSPRRQPNGTVALR